MGSTSTATVLAIAFATLVGIAIGRQLSRAERPKGDGLRIYLPFVRQPAAEEDESLREFLDYVVKNPGPVVALSIFVIGMVFSKFGDLDRRVSDLDKSVALGQQRTELQFDKFSERFDSLAAKLDRLAEEVSKRSTPL